MRFFRPGVQRIINLMLTGAAVCALVVPATWAYRQALEARRWRETACAYRSREAAGRTNVVLSVEYEDDDPCGTPRRPGLRAS
jgi:hypothetical protein